jgi:hypothetical protein
MATESPLIHDGAQTVAGADYRNSTYSGTTHAGNGGSPQFQAVRLSTVAERTVLLCTANGQPAYGLLQNKPALGEAADVGIFGVSKAIAGTTTILPGMRVMPDSSGCLIPYASAAGVAQMGYAISAPAAVGEVFSAYIFGYGPGSIA